MAGEIENSIDDFDNWMIQEIDFATNSNISGLGFKQLNDIIFYKHFPQFRENINTERGDDSLINKYNLIVNLPSIQSFDVAEYILIAENRLKKLPTQYELKQCEESYKKILFQNLVIVAFTLERWGQFVLRNKKGSTVRSVMISEAKISLHKYLCDELGNYNTLFFFALSSTAESNGFYYPTIENGAIKGGKKFESQSPYSSADFLQKEKISRFPSIMKLDSFMILIKKGELISYAYNYGLFKLMDQLKAGKLADPLVLQSISEIIYCFKVSIESFLFFLKDPFFNESKFILILRQLTVELSESPAISVLEDVTLSTHEKIRFKGFLDHYLSKKEMDKNERILFCKQILENEGVSEFEIKSIIKTSFNTESPLTKEELSERFDLFYTTTAKDLLANLVCELTNKSEIGVYRLRYALALFMKIAPRLEVFIMEKINDETWLQEKLDKIKSLDYYLAPSGANSIAFYGPDVVLGHAEYFPNYSIHMLNRLNVMIADDQDRFWKLQQYRENNLLLLLTQHFTSLPDVPIEIRYNPGKGEADAISAVLLKYPYLSFYVDLYEAFAALASAHNASVEKFIRRVGQKMDKLEKEKLVSSPDHGTTFMQPNTESELEQPAYNLPSLDKMTEVRSGHIFTNWVKPLKILRDSGKLADYPAMKLGDNTKLFF